MDNSGYWAQFDQEYEKCITDQHALMDELLHRGILQPAYFADLLYRNPHMQELVYTDPALFIMIVSELDISELLIFTHKSQQLNYHPMHRVRSVT